MTKLIGPLPVLYRIGGKLSPSLVSVLAAPDRVSFTATLGHKASRRLKLELRSLGIASDQSMHAVWYLPVYKKFTLTRTSSTGFNQIKPATCRNQQVLFSNVMMRPPTQLNTVYLCEDDPSMINLLERLYPVAAFIARKWFELAPNSKARKTSFPVVEGELLRSCD